MYNHAPNNYDNPFKAVFIEGDAINDRSHDSDIFYQDDDVTAFIAAGHPPNNPGNALVIPNQYYENLYDMPDELLAKVHSFAKKLAIAMKEVYGCDGVTVQQHNEPAGGQTVWHYHVHVFPRYEGDNMYDLYSEGFDSTQEREKSMQIS